jgi:membrane dipeptidase
MANAEKDQAPDGVSSRAWIWLSENLVIDGTVQPSAKSGEFDRRRGGLKARTGLNAGAISLPENSLERYLNWFDKQSGVFRLIRTAEDLRVIEDTGEYGVIGYMQKGYDTSNIIRSLDRWYDIGLRIFQPTYSENNALGSGSQDDRGPLTPLGRETIRHAVELGICPDVSHCGRRTTLDVTDLAAPVTANHCNADYLAPAKRNKSDEELQAIAATGGVVCPMPIGTYLKPPGARRATLSHYLDQLDYLVELVGISHVGISSDCWMDGQHAFPQFYCDDKLSSYERWYHVAEGLMDRGYEGSDVVRIFGRNLARVYEAIL